MEVLRGLDERQLSRRAGQLVVRRADVPFIDVGRVVFEPPYMLAGPEISVGGSYLQLDPTPATLCPEAQVIFFTPARGNIPMDTQSRYHFFDRTAEFRNWFAEQIPAYDHDFVRTAATHYSL